MPPKFQFGINLMHGKGKAGGLKPLAKPKPMAMKFDIEDDNQSAEDVRQTMNHIMMRETARKQKEADQKIAEMQAEDPTIFDYDGHYEEDQKKQGGHVGHKVEKDNEGHRIKEKPKYIANLLAQAERRKREDDLVMARKMQKEREVDDHLYGEKDKYLTAAYKKQLEEGQHWERLEQEQAAEEARNAANKKSDMSNFYKNYLFDTVEAGKADVEKTAASGLTEEAQRRVNQRLLEAGLLEEQPQAATEHKQHEELQEPDWNAPAPGFGQQESEPNAPEGASKPTDDAEPTEAAPAEEEAAPAEEEAGAAAEEVHRPRLEARLKREADEALAKAEREKVINTKRNDEGAVNDARARYLARKKQKTA